MPSQTWRGGGMSRRVAFWATAYALVVALTATTLATPLYVLYQREWGFSPGTLTIVFAVYMVAVFLSLLVLGRLSDQIGRRPVILGALVLGIIASALAAIAPAVGWLIVARNLVGVSAGLMNATVTATLTELHPTGDPKRAALIASSCTTGGLALGPLVAGLSADFLPYPLITPYALTIALMVPALLGIWRSPETVAVRAAQIRIRPRIGVPRPMLIPFLLCGMTCFAGFAVLAEGAALTPSYLQDVLGIRALDLGGFLVSINFGSSAIAQLVLRRLSPLRAVAYGLMALVGGVVLIVLASPFQSVALLIAATVLGGIGQGLSFMGSLALINRLAPPDRRGEIVAGYFALGYLGGTAPVIGTGFLAGWFGLYTATICFAGLIALIAAGLLIGFRLMIKTKNWARLSGAA